MAYPAWVDPTELAEPGQTVVTITGVNSDPADHLADPQPARRTEAEMKAIGQALADFFALTHSLTTAGTRKS